MLENLSDRLGGVMKKLRGEARLTESNVQDALRETRLALLEADVALPVVKTFIAELKEKVLGDEAIGSLTPGQAFVGKAHDALKELLGEGHTQINLASQPPAVILMAGLQGVGKTTTTGKLAKQLKEQFGKKKVLLVSTDTARPAAMKQLQILASSIGVDFVEGMEGKTATEIATLAMQKAKVGYYDVLIVDTAGRLSIDEALMSELKEIATITNPVESLLVIDAMAGQDAINVGRSFAEQVTLTGVILTKLDGDARGGAALSVKSVTGLPIKFAGTSERLDGLEVFHPERMAGRILGMGDILSLVEQAHQVRDEKEAARLEKKLKSGETFDLEDFASQLRQMRKMGGVSSFMDKMPSDFKQLAQKAPAATSDKQFSRMEGIICSMTPQEKSHPELIKASRKKRIAVGAGVQVQEVNQLLTQYESVASLMKMMQQGGLGKLMGKLGGMAGVGGFGGSKSKNKKKRK